LINEKELNMKRSLICLPALLAVGLSVPAIAQDMEATVEFTATGVIVMTRGPYRNMELTITGPNEFQTSKFSGKEAPAIDLRNVDIFDDGVYNYRVTAATDKKVPIRTGLNNGRGDIAKERLMGTSLAGSFVVKNGVIVKPENIEEK
jgi:hypothetical protein